MDGKKAFTSMGWIQWTSSSPWPNQRSWHRVCVAWQVAFNLYNNLISETSIGFIYQSRIWLYHNSRSSLLRPFKGMISLLEKPWIPFGITGEQPGAGMFFLNSWVSWWTDRFPNGVEKPSQTKSQLFKKKKHPEYYSKLLCLSIQEVFNLSFLWMFSYLSLIWA